MESERRMRDSGVWGKKGIVSSTHKRGFTGNVQLVLIIVFSDGKAGRATDVAMATAVELCSIEEITEISLYECIMEA